jgi:hypothetical protein
MAKSILIQSKSGDIPMSASAGKKKTTSSGQQQQATPRGGFQELAGTEL